MINTYYGMDFGMGDTNIDHVTGIRYGVIHHGTVGSFWYDESEGIYLTPKDSPELMESIKEGDTDFIISWFSDYGISLDEDLERDLENGKLSAADVFEQLEYLYNKHAEPEFFNYEKDGYYAQQGYDDPDIFILKSPYYTYGLFCSPCAPGAIDLDNPIWRDTPDNNKAYCFGHEWFESGKAPYRVFSVETEEEIFPKN